MECELEARDWSAHDQEFSEILSSCKRFNEMRVPRTEPLANTLSPVMKGNDDQVLWHGVFNPAMSPIRKNVIPFAGKLSIPLPEAPCTTNTRNRQPARPTRAFSALPPASR